LFDAYGPIRLMTCCGNILAGGPEIAASFTGDLLRPSTRTYFVGEIRDEKTSSDT